MAANGSSGGDARAKSLSRRLPELRITEHWIRERLNLQLDSLGTSYNINETIGDGS